MISYALKINDKYFKEYVYADKNTIGRYAGHSQCGVVIQEGDIIDIITTKEPERTEIKRSVGNTISTIYQIEKLRDNKIEIIPVKDSEN